MTEVKLDGCRPTRCQPGAGTGSSGYAAAGQMETGGIGATPACASPTQAMLRASGTSTNLPGTLPARPLMLRPRA
eukprot:5988837-Lingulodinium_polyedra.AAC.1